MNVFKRAAFVEWSVTGTTAQWNLWPLDHESQHVPVGSFISDYFFTFYQISPILRDHILTANGIFQDRFELIKSCIFGKLHCTFKSTHAQDLFPNSILNSLFSSRAAHHKPSWDLLTFRRNQSTLCSRRNFWSCSQNAPMPVMVHAGRTSSRPRVPWL